MQAAQNQETAQQTIARLQAELAQAKANARPQKQEISLSPKGFILFAPKGHKGWPLALTPTLIQAIIDRQGELQQFAMKNALEIAARTAEAAKGGAQ